MGVVHKLDPGWGSFMPVLIKCLELTQGPVLELGMGYFSTPLIHIMCETKGYRDVMSYDNDERFIGMFSRFKAPWHGIHLVEDWETVYSDIRWGVALVDQKPAEARKESIKKLTRADYVIIHDSNDPIYDYESIYPLFKYRFTHEYLQHTTVLSNKHDVKNFLHNS